MIKRNRFFWMYVTIYYLYQKKLICRIVFMSEKNTIELFVSKSQYRTKNIGLILKKQA